MGPLDKRLVPIRRTFRDTLVDHPRWTYESCAKVASVSYSETEWAEVRKLADLFTEDTPAFCRP